MPAILCKQMPLIDLNTGRWQAVRHLCQYGRTQIQRVRHVHGHPANTAKSGQPVPDRFYRVVNPIIEAGTASYDRFQLIRAK